MKVELFEDVDGDMLLTRVNRIIGGFIGTRGEERMNVLMLDINGDAVPFFARYSSALQDAKTIVTDQGHPVVHMTEAVLGHDCWMRADYIQTVQEADGGSHVGTISDKAGDRAGFKVQESARTIKSLLDALNN